MLIITTILWLILMTFLSHVKGSTSGEESRWLSSMTGIKEGLLRQSAHVVVYAVLAILVIRAWPGVPLYIRIGGLVLWAGIDEWSKGWRWFPDRHCSIAEFGLNILGVAIGTAAGILIG